jgi:hypothetical protein
MAFTVCDDVYIAYDEPCRLACQRQNIVYDGVYHGKRWTLTMTTDKEWAEQVKGLLKAELKRRGVTYEDLSRRLAEIGVEDTPENIANKVSRGKFTAVFLVQCLEAIGCGSVHISQA